MRKHPRYSRKHHDTVENTHDTAAIETPVTGNAEPGEKYGRAFSRRLSPGVARAGRKITPGISTGTSASRRNPCSERRCRRPPWAGFPTLPATGLGSIPPSFAGRRDCGARRVPRAGLVDGSDGPSARRRAHSGCTGGGQRRPSRPISERSAGRWRPHPRFRLPLRRSMRTSGMVCSPKRLGQIARRSTGRRAIVCICLHPGRTVVYADNGSQGGWGD
jgi:hypothetical protein